MDAQRRLGATGYRYRLADDWHDRPWRAEAGRYGHAGDLGSGPDGTIFLLDEDLGAIHVLAPDGTPLRLLPLPPEVASGAWTAGRLDVGPDGTIFLLSRRPRLGVSTVTRVDGLSAAGLSLSSFQSAVAFSDLAAGSDGTLYLAAVEGAAGIQTFDAMGNAGAAFGQGLLTIPVALDVGPDGSVYVVDRQPIQISPPGPEPTPQPSFGALPLDAGESVVVFDLGHGLRKRVPFVGGQDLSAGGAGVFVARGLEIFRLEEAAPRFSMPYGSTGSPLDGNVPLHLNVTAGGRLVASVWHCYFQGLLRFDRPSEVKWAPAWVGATDAPALEGPAYPERVAAGASAVAVLQGRFAAVRGRGEATFFPAYFAADSEPQSLQSWSASGALKGQVGVCAGQRRLNAVWWARDVAMDGERLYTLDAASVERRDAEPLPQWKVLPEGLRDGSAPAYLVALAADAGRIAVLDAGARRVLVLDADGHRLDEWSTESSAGGVLVDIALHGTRVYLADGSRETVLVRDLAGFGDAGWRVAGGVKRVAADPSGDVLVLTQDGWVDRYGADGVLSARWRPADVAAAARVEPGELAAAVPLDLGVGPDGKVYVSYWRREPSRAVVRPAPEEIAQSGVWVFAPEEVAFVPVAPQPGACEHVPGATASPAAVRIGEAVTVSLGMSGSCPHVPVPSQVILVVDASRSMLWNDARLRAEAAVFGFLSALDPARTEVGVVTFADGASLRLGLTSDLGRVMADVVSVQAKGNSRLGDGIDVALAELAGARRQAETRPIIILVTDGGYKDAPQDAAGRAAQAGVQVHAMVFRNDDFRGISAVGNLTGRGGRVVLDPDPEAAGLLAREVTSESGVSDVFRAVSIEALLPGHMAYVVGSSRPAARAVGGRLSWDLVGGQVAGGVTVTFQAMPTLAGRWPALERATARYVDALGGQGLAEFTVPEVDVLPRRSVGGGASWLPLVGRGWRR